LAIDVLPKNNNIVVVAGLHEKVEVVVFVVSPEIALVIVAAFNIV
jgi:hypothetical protein